MKLQRATLVRHRFYEPGGRLVPAVLTATVAIAAVALFLAGSGSAGAQSADSSELNPCLSLIAMTSTVEPAVGMVRREQTSATGDCSIRLTAERNSGVNGASGTSETDAR